MKFKSMLFLAVAFAVGCTSDWGHSGYRLNADQRVAIYEFYLDQIDGSVDDPECRFLIKDTPEVEDTILATNRYPCLRPAREFSRKESTAWVWIWHGKPMPLRSTSFTVGYEQLENGVYSCTLTEASSSTSIVNYNVVAKMIDGKFKVISIKLDTDGPIS